MKVFIIIFAIVVIAIIIAFVYEIKYTYRDDNLWK